MSESEESIKVVEPVEIANDLKLLVRTGSVVLGSKRTLKSVLHGRGKLVILAKNCPENYKSDIMRYAALSKIPVVVFNGNNMELGQLCGKPFSVAALLVLDFGTSELGRKLGVVS